jgi:hypothetical protein
MRKAFSIPALGGLNDLAKDQLNDLTKGTFADPRAVESGKKLLKAFFAGQEAAKKKLEEEKLLAAMKAQELARRRAQAAQAAQAARLRPAVFVRDEDWIDEEPYQEPYVPDLDEIELPMIELNPDDEKQGLLGLREGDLITWSENTMGGRVNWITDVVDPRTSSLQVMMCVVKYQGPPNFGAPVGRMLKRTPREMLDVKVIGRVDEPEPVTKRESPDAKKDDDTRTAYDCLRDLLLF